MFAVDDPPPPGPGKFFGGRVRRAKSVKSVSVEARFVYDLILLVFTILLGLRFTPGFPLMELEWIIGSQIFRLCLFPFILIVFILNLRVKRWRSVSWSILLIALLLFEGYNTIPLQKSEPVSLEKSERVRVLTYNTGVQWPEGLIDHMVKQDVDIVILQEFYTFFRDSLFKIAEEKGYLGRYLKLRDDSGTGLVLLTRGELVNQNTLHVESFRGKWRRFGVADLQYGDHLLRLIGVHFESNSRKLGFSGFLQAWSFRREQAEVVASVVDTTHVPVLVVGDMNATATDRSIRPIYSKLQDAWVDAGYLLGGTWNREHPFLRIDYVLHDGFTSAANAKVLTNLLSSDHLALQADLVW